ncbi:tyrosine protein kinase [Paenibacillus paeoniae]|uniref:Tyrosine protein kinase n=1 Tax=Paenibacillus paeoniae TaxID=2292705 RepID=A0A371PFV8_9BACL|nr:tyrosine protein kinase [Paenibacillus paeoniae]REK74843.1 tyrosine protein kinase [Paenibacillus paeoniae]
MNYHQYPGVGNRGGAGRNQDYAQQQGQNPLSRPYNGQQEAFHHTGDATPPQNVHISQTQASPSLLPAVIPPSQTLEVQPKKGFSLSNLTSLANLNEIKGFVDRMGGLDGILTTITKVQKVVGSITQMAPLAKVFMGTFGKKSKESSGGSSSERRPSRRKSRRSGTGSGRSKSGTTSRRRGSRRKR